jgi:hypothetical protein
VSGCDCEISSLISSSLASKREGKRLQVGEEIGATFIGMESRLTWQEIDGIEEGGGVTTRGGHARGFRWRKKILTTLAHLSARRERERGTDSGGSPDGTWVVSVSGRNGFPVALSIFLLLFFFFFFCFLFLS